MTKRPYTLGFIGGGLNSAVGYAHYAALGMDGLWGLKAGVFSRSPKVNLETGRAYGVKPDRIHPSVDEFLEKESGSLDAVVILTPTETHFEIVQKCLQAKIPIICEKSLACTVREGRILQEMNENQGGFLRVIYNYSGYPMIREARHLIRSDILGKILHFQVEMPQEGYIRKTPDGKMIRPQDWRLKDGALPILHLDLAVHLHELIFYLTGNSPLEVIADQDSFGNFKVVDNVSCLCRYTDGVKGTFWFSKSALGQRNGLRVRIYGTRASLEWFQLNPEELMIARADGHREILDAASDVNVCGLPRYRRFKPGHPSGFIEALSNLYADIRTDLSAHIKREMTPSDEVFGADLSVEGLLFFEAMVKSFNSGCWEPAKGRIDRAPIL